MTPETRGALRAHLKQEEGLRLKPYTDTMGVLTVGYGRAIGRIGISRDEAELMLDNDITRSVKDATFIVPAMPTLDPVRQQVVVSMLFQLGLGTFMEFRRCRAALERRDFDQAADEMLDSAWARQTPARVHRLATAMRTGLLQW